MIHELVSNSYKLLSCSEIPNSSLDVSHLFSFIYYLHEYSLIGLLIGGAELFL